MLIISLIIVFYKKIIGIIFQQETFDDIPISYQYELSINQINLSNLEELKKINLNKIPLYKEDKIKKNFILFRKKQNKNKIHICMSSDLNLIYPTLVSMTSALENNNENINILVYHLFLPSNITDEDINIFESLKSKYRVRIYYYKIPPIFEQYRAWGGSTTVYWKLLIPFILPNLKRYIFLDGDTLVFEDLSDMYNLNFNDTYVFGFFFHTASSLRKFRINVNNYINSGVILINNEKIIKDGKDIELLKFTLENSKKMSYPTQDPLNAVFNPNIGILPLKYGLYLIGNINVFNKFKKYIKYHVNETELIEAINKPAIIHLCCCNPKIWHKESRHDFGDNSTCIRYHNDFYYYANKTDYYKDMYNIYIKENL